MKLLIGTITKTCCTINNLAGKSPTEVTADAPPSDVASFTIPGNPNPEAKSDPIHQEVENLLGHNPMYNLEHDIVEKPTFLQRFWNGPMYEGKNVFGNKVFIPYYGGTAPSEFTIAGEAGAAATVFEDISTTSRSITNFFVGITATKFESALAKAAGEAWEITKDGKAKTIIYNGLKYVSRLSTKGEPTIDIYRGEQLLQKYRLQ